MGFDHPSWLLFAIPVGLLWHLFHHRRKVLNRWRAAILILVVLAFAGLYMRLPRPGGMVVVLADRSASLPENATDLQMEAIRRLQQEMAPRQQLAVVSFGGRAAVEQQPHSGAFNGFTLDLGRDQTRLADALELGTSLVPDGVPARFLVLGDGQWTGRDPLNAARQAALRDIAVDYRVLNRDTGRDLSIHSIDAPQSVAQGQSFLIHAWIDAPDTLEGTYALERNGQRIASGTRTLEQGLNHLVFRDRLAASGPAAYRLAINGEATDPVPENNRARFIVGSDGKLPVLLLSTTANGALDRLLEETGMQVDTRDPAGFDWSLESLSRYSGVVIENVSAGDLGTRGMELLASWVEATGHGLFMTGGKRSYGAGGFFQSPLERIMPVSMELRREHSKLALAIAVPGTVHAKYQKTKPVGWGPRTSKAAAKLVNRNGYEPRRMNAKDNHRVPGRKLLRAWRKRSEMPYKRFVNGRFNRFFSRFFDACFHRFFSRFLNSRFRFCIVLIGVK